MSRIALALALVLSGCSSHSPSASLSHTPEVTKLVLDDLGSPAFGGQHPDPRCVTVSPSVVATGTTVVAARISRETGCGNSTTNDLLWIYVRSGSGGWTEQYLGAAPSCWRGVPADIADAVATVSGLARCQPGSAVSP